MARIDEFQRIAIAIELDQGTPIPDIASQFGVSEQYVKKLAAEVDLVPGTAPKKRVRLTPADKEEMIEMLEGGEDVETVALCFGISEKYIRRFCKERKIAIPRAKPLTEKERLEILQLLNDGDAVEEIAEAYQVSLDAVVFVRDGEYKKLSTDALGFLFESLRGDPHLPPRTLRAHARLAGFDVPLTAILAYRRRLKGFNML